MHLKNCVAAKFFFRGFFISIVNQDHLTEFDMFDKQLQLALNIMIGHGVVFLLVASHDISGFGRSL